MTDGELVQLERQISADTQAIQWHLAAVYCGMCGTRKDEDGTCPYGCDQPASTPVWIISDEPQASGNFYRDEVVDYRHPTW